MHTTFTVFMVRPVNFAFNQQTAKSNAFQDVKTQELNLHDQALKEFDQFVKVLRDNDVNVIVIDDKPDPHTPDSIFPNNWISTHSDGKVFIYPMEASNRRNERRPEILEELRNRFRIESEIDLTFLESEGKYLEGTGSMVLDRQNKLAYACISPRTDKKALTIFCDLSGYKPVVFHAFDKSGQAIYHTNVMMCIGDLFAVICLESITNADERERISNLLLASGKEIIDISYEQMRKFAGNMLHLTNSKGQSLLVMSRQAHLSLSATQQHIIDRYCKIVSSPLYTIESGGGGSARCMIAEIYLENR
ncbi:citrulline utilization hydrolase CtlX [Paradesertivirga mongoliensis]|uniref:Citrulline utilization hydrolase CtlX n=1 Tax=Paradesertivirga mongoliensis TaxID=2100740 RepID=A0ABW4ZMC1_9SPHI|nr:arginine deiminase-related protein [Pedobacter mongoliensis]